MGCCLLRNDYGFVVGLKFSFLGTFHLINYLFMQMVIFNYAFT